MSITTILLDLDETILFDDAASADALLAVGRYARQVAEVDTEELIAHAESIAAILWAKGPFPDWCDGIGTSAIGAALGERQPVWLHRGEHFFNDTSVYSCAGAPLIGPTGACVGMLDLTGIDAPERPELKHLVARSARAIEDALAWLKSLPGQPASFLTLSAKDVAALFPAQAKAA